jgi:hypothetical protein
MPPNGSAKASIRRVVAGNADQPAKYRSANLRGVRRGGDSSLADSAPSSWTRITALLVANASLLIAALVYMGWAYENAEYGYFHINPIDLNVGIAEYMLRSLNLFSPLLVIVATVAIIIGAAWGSNLTLKKYVPLRGRLVIRRAAGPLRRGRAVNHTDGRWPGRDVAIICVGGAITAVSLILYFSQVRITQYAYLGMFAIGPLLLTLPIRSKAAGRAPYSLAVILAAICSLWAASLYAEHLGVQHARYLAHGGAVTIVVVYSARPLDLSGPGITVEHLPAHSFYQYRYQGLRLLTMRSGTYYLFSARRNEPPPITYILDSGDQIRVELSD